MRHSHWHTDRQTDKDWRSHSLQGYDEKEVVVVVVVTVVVVRLSLKSRSLLVMDCDEKEILKGNVCKCCWTQWRQQKKKEILYIIELLVLCPF